MLSNKNIHILPVLIKIELWATIFYIYYFLVIVLPFLLIGFTLIKKSRNKNEFETNIGFPLISLYRMGLSKCTCWL